MAYERISIGIKSMKIKKGEQVFTFFCPKSTMNLTYLCYGDTKVNVIWLSAI